MSRPQRARTDDWQQLEVRSTDPVQRVYELIRPIVRCDDAVPARATATATPERTLYRHLDRSTTSGGSHHYRVWCTP